MPVCLMVKRSERFRARGSRRQQVESKYQFVLA